MRQHAETWLRYANLKFKFVEPHESAEIRVGFDRGGSWSAIGREALGIPFEFSTMNFGWLNDDTPEDSLKRVVLHEFGHAIGLIHEHSSPVSQVQWDKDKAYAFYRDANNWSDEELNHNIFDRYRVTQTNYSQYDPLSIMHYPVPAAITLNGKGVPWNTELSDVDKKFIGLWYPFPENDEGVLRTNDDCDQIEFRVERNVIARDKIEFYLEASPHITWWKAVRIPLGQGGHVLEIHDRTKDSGVYDFSQLDTSRSIFFGKAKQLGVKTWLTNYRWDVMRALRGGCRVFLKWTRDNCGG